MSISALTSRLARSWLCVFYLACALRAASIVSFFTLAVLGELAVRRTHLEWWKQVIALAMLVGLGLAVIGLQQLAHAH